METIIIYLFKVTLSLAIFYSLYMLLLRKETFFKLNRIYFLFAVIFSLLFPFIEFSGFNSAETNIIPHYWLNAIAVGDESNGASTLPDLWGIIFIVLTLGSGVFLIRFLMQLWSTIIILKKHSKIDLDGYKLIHTDSDNIPTCSFFGWLILNTKYSIEDQQQTMIEHEKVHISQHHSIDVLLFEILCIFLWWNPFAWLLKHEMKLNLEYLADEGVQRIQEDNKRYQYLLVQINTANTGVAIINNFNISNLKKRIIMMNKTRSSLLSSMKYLVAIPMAFLLVCCNSDRSDNEQLNRNTSEIAIENQSREEAFDTVDEMPIYDGGTEAMIKYISENLKYPETAENNNIQGRVVIRFIVSKTGNVQDVKVLRGIDKDCDAEAIRVVKAMPKWKPGKQNGKAVNVYFTLPINFRLKK